MFPLILAGLGLLAPRMILDRRIGSRRQRLESEFPDALDLLVVCVEAGLGLEAAILRVGQETRLSHPLFSRELETLAQELNAGKSRADALRSLARRSELETLNAFVALLVQSEQLGVIYSRTIRSFSNELREKRFVRAEEKAMRIPLLISIPLMLCILPCLIVAVMLPSIIDMSHLLPTMTGVHP
jgi:tight adherence protein C